MFKFLRSNAKFFYWVIAATFIAFIFVAWGMDVAGSGSGPNRGSTVVGSVNGGNHVVPTVKFADGSTLTNPSLKQVQAKLAA